MTENRVGIRELKNKLSDYLRRVKAGETIIITEHGRTIGQLIPVKPSIEEKNQLMVDAGQADWNGKKLPIGQLIPVKPSIEEKNQLMVDAGQADWNGKKLPPHQPLVINKGDRLLSDLVIENRQ